jgi:hypothetical protein
METSNIIKPVKSESESKTKEYKEKIKELAIEWRARHTEKYRYFI